MTEYEDKVVKVFVIADWHFKDFYNTTKKKKKKKNDFYILWKRLLFFSLNFLSLED